jgi:hypothetical protein
LTKIPLIAFHRGVGIHDQQPAERVERIVKPEIDLVLDKIEGVRELYDFARDVANCPEARLLAAAKIEGIWQLKAEAREARPPGVTLELVKAVVAGLAGQTWRDKYYYCTMLDVREVPGSPRRAVKREVPLPDKWPAPETAAEPAGERNAR